MIKIYYATTHDTLIRVDRIIYSVYKEISRTRTFDTDMFAGPKLNGVKNFKIFKIWSLSIVENNKNQKLNTLLKIKMRSSIIDESPCTKARC